MEKLPSSWKASNRTTRQFREQYAKLPARIQKLTMGACRLFHKSPDHPSLRYHLLEDRRTGSHDPGSWSVSITMQYRAVHVKVDGVNVWYWIGTHAQYKRFTGSKR